MATIKKAAKAFPEAVRPVDLLKLEKGPDNTFLGVSKIINPTVPKTIHDEWKGNYVYFGHYNGKPILFRVLDKDTTRYGGRTIFLDSDITLFGAFFDKSEPVSNIWEKSDLRADLNGSKFLKKSGVFTVAERTAIAESYVESHAMKVDDISLNQYYPHIDMLHDWFPSYTALTGEKIFVLDIEDATDKNYGYIDVYGYAESRHKDPAVNGFWLRNAAKESDIVAAMMFVGGLMPNAWTVNRENSDGSTIIDVSPAMNVALAAVLFSTCVMGNAGKAGARYKLTIIDTKLKVALKKAGVVSRSGSKLTVPYVLSGADAKNAKKLSLVCTRKGINEDGATLKYYIPASSFKGTAGVVNDGVPTEGTALFELPSNFALSKDCHAYVIAEDVRARFETDYASIPCEISPKALF